MNNQGYSPLKKEGQNRINEAWNEYRHVVGLEGDMFYEFIQAGKTVQAAAQLVGIGQGDREAYRQIWESTWFSTTRE